MSSFFFALLEDPAKIWDGMSSHTAWAVWHRDIQPLQHNDTPYGFLYALD